MQIFRRFFSEPEPAAVLPETTPAEYLAEADRELRIARDEYALACKNVSGWRLKHPEYAKIGERVFRQFIPSPELRELSRRESQAHSKMCGCMEARAILIARFQPEEKFIGGVKV